MIEALGMGESVNSLNNQIRSGEEAGMLKAEETSTNPVTFLGCETQLWLNDRMLKNKISLCLLPFIYGHKFIAGSWFFFCLHLFLCVYGNTAAPSG